MKQISVPIIDESLTPRNAKDRGYKYIADIVFNPSLPNPEIVELINDHGHKLGKPFGGDHGEDYVGIYAPLYETI